MRNASDHKTELHRSLKRWSRLPHHQHRDVDAFCATFLRDGLHSIDAGAAPIDLVVTGTKGAPLVICLDGNAPRGEDRNPPFFSGFGVIPKDFPVSHVAVSDTTLALADDLTLSWYAGSEGIPLQSILPRVFKHIIRDLEPSSVWFFGGSGGGFASAYYANTIPNSTALIWNPQTDILGYNLDHVLKYAKVGFGIESGQDTLSHLALRVNARLPFNGTNQLCKIIYMQNRTDWHVARQLGPLLDRMGLPRQTGPFSGLVSRNFYLYIGEWGSGHAAPPKPALSSILTAVLSADRDLFANHGSRIHEIMNTAFESKQTLSITRPETDQDRLARLERCLAAIDTASIEDMKAILKHLLEDRLSEYRHRLDG